MRSDDNASSPDDSTGEEAKDRFREALNRKRERQHPHERASQGNSKVHDTASAAGSKRQFRRKSG